MNQAATPVTLSIGTHPFCIELREDHARFSRVLMLIGREAHRLETYPESVLPLFKEAIDYIVNFQNIHHHPREELLFSRIAGDSHHLKRLSDQLSKEHMQLGKAGRKLMDQMNKLGDTFGSRAVRAELAKSLDRFANDMRAHINDEEELMYTRASSFLSLKDWDEIAAASTSEHDPLQYLTENDYPLLSRYVIKGCELTRVHPGHTSFYQRSLPDVRGGLVIIQRHVDEFLDLSSRTLREMPLIPAFQPNLAYKVLCQSGEELLQAGKRWLLDWRDWQKLPRR